MSVAERKNFLSLNFLYQFASNTKPISMKKNIYTLIFISFFSLKSVAQTMGLMQHDSGTIDNGYVLFSPIGSTKTYLIDKCGKEVKEWNSAYRPGQAVYLLPDGNLLRAGNANNTTFISGGQGGVIEKIDWSGNVLWSYSISSNSECQHHDIKPLPNGNVLAIVWDNKSNSAAVAEGRDPSWLSTSLWSEKIIELQPIGADSANIVWEWHVWDHLVQEYDSTKNNFGIVGLHPELLNINFPGIGLANFDWLHMNSVDYNPQLDQILMSSHNFNEIWVIDHSTTTAQASSHSGGNSGKGGDLLYRWGNPQTYNNGLMTDKKLFGQHNAKWITPGLPFEGSIMIFNNGAGRPAGNFSSIDIITTPVNTQGEYNQSLPYLPSGLTWTYEAPTPTDFYSSNISGAQIFENGNLLICAGAKGTFFEIDSSKNTVWNYINPIGATGAMTQGSTPSQNQCFRAEFYPMDFSGFAGYSLIAGLPLEINPLPYTCELDTAIEIINGNTKLNSDLNSFSIYPIPADDFFILRFNNFNLDNSEIKIYDLSGREIFIPLAISNSGIQFDSKSLFSGIYFIFILSEGKISRSKFVIAE